MVKENDVRETKEHKWCVENPELYEMTVVFQKLLHEQGIAWHNTFSNECTPDFNCCTDDGSKATLKLPQKVANTFTVSEMRNAFNAGRLFEQALEEMHQVQHKTGERKLHGGHNFEDWFKIIYG